MTVQYTEKGFISSCLYVKCDWIDEQGKTQHEKYRSEQLILKNKKKDSHDKQTETKTS